MAAEHYAVIMAGGKGERFWPLSTSERPKQLLALVGDKSLLAQAVDRLDGLIPPERVFVVTNKNLVQASREAAPILPPENIVGEPMGRDTAAAVALSGALIGARSVNASFCILTADQVMGDLDVYRRTLQESLDLASQQEVLITIGIQPTSPSTAFGYVEAGPELQSGDKVTFHRARRFVEKPDESTADRYIHSGRYFWNSGMFIWSVKALHAAFKKHCPELSWLMETLTTAVGDDSLDAVLEAAYPPLEKISIDYALMEKADNIIMAKGTFAWDDVGSWTALSNHFAADESGNITIGSLEALDSGDNIVFSRDRTTAMIGVSDLIVVQAEGVTLICPKDRAQDIKLLLQQVRNNPDHRDII
jgi:mannose-1-phosphate guanylyltransferase